MTSDKELADKIVALGVGNNTYDLYAIGAYHVIGCDDSDFVRDWRVAGALMEKCKFIQRSETTTRGSYVTARGKQWGYGEAPEGEAARAIIEACVEALS